MIEDMLLTNTFSGALRSLLKNAIDSLESHTTPLPKTMSTGFSCSWHVQFFRIHFLIRKWTRQKVFHAMVAVSNFGECTLHSHSHLTRIHVFFYESAPIGLKVPQLVSRQL
jgi:hypothetical protein